MMKLRLLYIIFAAVIIVILLSIWVTKQGVKIQPQVTTSEQNMLVDYATQLPVTSEKKSAITIIKPLPKEKSAPDLTQQPKESRPPATPTTSDVSSSSVPPERETESGSDESDSGITKIDNKHPSEIESEEMNQRGIVMW